MKKLNINCKSAVAAIGFFTLSLMLLPLMTTPINAQAQPGEIINISEKHFRKDGDDPDRFRLEDNDVIHLKIEKVDELKGKIEIILKSSSNITWWKASPYSNRCAT